MSDSLKTLKDIELQICRRKETLDGLSEECFCEEDLKKELRASAREWIEYLGGIPEYVMNAEIELKKAMKEEDSDTKFMQIDTCVEIIARWKTKNSNNAKIDWIVDFFNLGGGSVD